MPIASLPLSTINAIGSTQVLSDSASVVKELIDNALDADASIISVEVAVNGLDLIQVRDNGHGIASEDRALVFRRYCTSKISELRDIEKIGGTCLGFRGEALASATEMSGAIVLITRIAGEPVATSLKINRQGEIASQDHVSHPIGTTVRVSDFLKYLPVRRQAALKSPLKTNSSIKAVLRVYAIARPSVRFSLKVLKAKNEKGNWTYVPKPHATMLDVAVQVLDSTAVGQCKWHTWRPPVSSCSPISTTDLHYDMTKFSIEALLPTPDCEPSLVSQVGQYISIDSRPMSCSRGVLKQLVSLHKSYLRSSFTTEAKKKLAEPILCMNIVCPPGSYDPNVEPAKDDVLFTSCGDFIFMVESFFKHIYGELRGITIEKTLPKSYQSKGFELLLNRKPRLTSISETSRKNERNSLGTNSELAQLATPDGVRSDMSIPMSPTVLNSSSNSLLEDSEVSFDQDDILPSPSRLISAHSAHTHGSKDPQRPSDGRPNMYSVDSDDDFHIQGPEEPAMEIEDSVGDVRNTSNPWSIAKMNSPIRRNSLDRDNAGISYPNGQLMTPARQVGEVSHAIDSLISRQELTNLPKPQRSKLDISLSHPAGSPPPDGFLFPQRAWRNSKKDKQLVTHGQVATDKAGGGALDRWVEKTPSKGFVSAQTLLMGTPLESIPDFSERPRKSSKNENNPHHRDDIKLSSSSVNDPHNVWFDIGPKRKSYAELKSRPQLDFTTIPQLRPDSEDEHSVPAAVSPSAPMANTVHPDLAITLDYETRKQAAILKRRESMRRRARLDEEEISIAGRDHLITSSVSSPHQNRYRKALAALKSTGEVHGSQQPVFPPGDPRAYFLRLQQVDTANLAKAKDGGSTHKLKRRKTAMLPLETIPVNETIHDIVLTLNPFQPDIDHLVKTLSNCDEYIQTGKKNFDALTRITTVEELQSLENSLRDLLSKTGLQAESEPSSVPILFDLQAILQDHRTNIGRSVDDVSCILE